MSIGFTVWLHALSIVAAAYLLGSIPTGYLLVRLFRKQDIRTLGSGNIGATNVLRSGAKGLGAATFALDVLKGALAVFVGARLAAMGSPNIRPHDAEALAALCAVLGHMFPIWLGLRGGKGVATAFGVFLVVAPVPALASLAVFILVMVFSRIVSLASILSSAAFPAFGWGFAPAIHEPWLRTPLIFAILVLVSALIVWKHGPNIQRLLAGTEYRFSAGSKKPPAGTSNTSGEAKGPA